MKKTNFSPSLAIAALLAGCQTVAPLAASVKAGDRSLTVHIAAPRQVQTLVTRHLVSDVDHYVATVLLTGVPQKQVTVKPLNATSLTFGNLGRNQYTVQVVGYDASNNAITSTASQAVDLTASNDVTNDPSVTLQPVMLDVAFSGQVTLPAAPSWATQMEAVVTSGGTTLSDVTYTPGQNATAANLAAGTTYSIAVTATDGLYSNTQTISQTFDASAVSVDDATAPAFTFAAPAPGTKLRTPGGFSGPSAVAVDGSGNAWVVNESLNNVTELSSTGSVLGSYAVGTTPGGVAVDGSGNIWVANINSNNVTELSSTGSVLGTYGAGTNPRAIAADPNSGNVWVTNEHANQVVELSSTGSMMGTYGVGNYPIALAVDGSGNVWVANYGAANVTELTSTGSVIGTYAAGANPRGIARDGSGNFWVANQTGPGYVTELSSTGSPTGTYAVGNGPIPVAVDGNGNVWVGNNGDSTVTELTSTGSVLGTYAVTGGATGIATGASYVWVTNGGSSTVTELAD